MLKPGPNRNRDQTIKRTTNNKTNAHLYKDDNSHTNPRTSNEPKDITIERQSQVLKPGPNRTRPNHQTNNEQQNKRVHNDDHSHTNPRTSIEPKDITRPRTLSRPQPQRGGRRPRERASTDHTPLGAFGAPWVPWGPSEESGDARGAERRITTRPCEGCGEADHRPALRGVRRGGSPPDPRPARVGIWACPKP